MFDFGFLPKGIVLKKLIWLKASGIVGAAYQTFTGAIARFLSPSSKPVKSIVCNIEPVQDLHGYDNPWPAGGGKNLAPVNSWSGHSGIVSNMTLNIPANTEFTLSLVGTVDSGSAQYALIFIFSDNTDSGWISLNPSAARVSATRMYTKDVVGLKYYSNNAGWAASQDVTLTVTDFQIELGSSATSYAPYSNICPISGFTGLNVYGESEYDPTADPKVAVTWQSAAGTVYAGYISIDKGGNVTLTGTHGLSTLNGTENWVLWSSNGKKLFAVVPMISGENYNPGNDAASNQFKYIGKFGSPPSGMEEGEFLLNSVDGKIWNRNVSFYYPSFGESVDGWKTYLSNNPLTVLYPLATPITYTLSSVTVPSTVQGENNWWHDANGNITIEAIGTPISSDEPDALQSLNILLGGAYTPRANFSEPTDEQALNIIMGGSR